MAEIPLTVDVIGLHDVATRVEQAAEVIAGFRFAGLPGSELTGSAVAGVAAPGLIAARLGDVPADLRGWAAAARTSAGAFEAAEQNGVARLGTP
jgi:hypothetical protein